MSIPGAELIPAQVSFIPGHELIPAQDSACHGYPAGTIPRTIASSVAGSAFSPHYSEHPT
eukprot:16443348-Heterocapsa_arctica.AAC.1